MLNHKKINELSAFSTNSSTCESLSSQALIIKKYILRKFRPFKWELIYTQIFGLETLIITNNICQGLYDLNNKFLENELHKLL